MSNLVSPMSSATGQFMSWRRNPVGEVLTNLGFAHGILGSFLSIRYGLGWPAAMVAAAGIVAAMQSAGILAGVPGTAVAAATAIALVTAVPDDATSEAWLARGPFSPQAIAFNLILFSGLWAAHHARRLWNQAPASGRRAFLGWGVAMLCVGYLIVLPAFSTLVQSTATPSSQTLQDATLSERIRLHVMQAFFAVFFFSLGATVGSFLNVVVYRMPLGRSVVARASSCPKCGSPIAPRDNIPVVGWLLLNGRCRTCREPISARYPIVEFGLGLVFVLLYFVELISGGINLPVREPNLFTGVVWVLMYTKWDLVGLYAFHCFLFATLAAWSLMAVDGHLPPARSVVGALIPAVALPLLLPFLYPAPSGWTAGGMPSPPATLLCGAGAGLASGWLLSGARFGGEARGVLAACALVGITLGWKAVVLISALAGGFHVLHRLVSPPNASRSPLVGHVFVAALVHHVAWRWIDDWVWGASLPSETAGVRTTVIVATAAAVMLLAGLMWRKDPMIASAKRAMTTAS
jgi:leader peptidase (prepilin peptidase) / N-methyltransferase